MEIDINEFNSLVGDGYLKSEVEKMDNEKLLTILKSRIVSHINKPYNNVIKYGILDYDN